MSEHPEIVSVVPLSDEAPPTGNYSPGIRLGDMVFVSGQGPIDAAGNIVVGSIEQETALTISNIAAVLEAAGSDLSHVLSCNCYLSDMADFKRFDQAYGEAFGGHRPARTTVAAGLDGIKVEISVIAVRKAENSNVLSELDIDTHSDL